MGVTVDELRAFALSMPEAEEKSHFDNADFRVRNKIFVSLKEPERQATVKLSLEDQDALIARADGAFSLPGGWAKHGWTNIELDHADLADVEDLVIDAWLRVAPKKLHALLDPPAET
jgi:hypothetical protein